MADFFLSNLKSTLDNCITELDEIHSMFCRNPESDFTRNRKLSFREYIQFMLQMQSKSVSNAVNICRAYLKHDGNETESMLLIQKYLTPVKYNRMVSRIFASTSVPDIPGIMTSRIMRSNVSLASAARPAGPECEGVVAKPSSVR